jgi:hypothetical protein
LAPDRQRFFVIRAAACGNHGAKCREHHPRRRFRHELPQQFLNRFDGSRNTSPVEDVFADPVRGLAMRCTNTIPDILSCELPR